MTMARSKNCIGCKYCAPFDKCRNPNDWENYWCCTYYIDTGKSDDKGDDPDNCLLFTPSKGESRRRKDWAKGAYV